MLALLQEVREPTRWTLTRFSSVATLRPSPARIPSKKNAARSESG